MKTLQHLFSAFLILTQFACNSAEKRTKEINNPVQYGEYSQSISHEEQFNASETLVNRNSAKSFTQNGGKQTIHVKDPKTGIVINSVQYPAEWKVLVKPYYTFDDKTPLVRYFIKGPQGVNLFNNSPKPYFSLPNGPVGQMIRQYGNGSGFEFRPVKSVEQIVQQEIGTKMQREGFSYSGGNTMGDIKSYMEQQLREFGTYNGQVQTIGTVWKNEKNESAMAIINHIVVPQPLGQGETAYLWIYNIDYIFADASVFDKTLAAYKTALFTTQNNPQWKQLLEQRKAQAQREMQEQRRSASINHQNRMQQRQASFAAHQAKIQGINQAMDASHNNFMANLRGGTSSRGIGSNQDHSRFINMVRGEETVYRSDGSQFQVDAGYKDYYIDNYGNKIYSNNPSFDAENNIHLNSGQWERGKRKYDN